MQTNDLYLNKLHADILTIMDEIDRVCRENNLRYYLIGGTLLGAIRHKGFIPWDDDLDIVMPREDMNKFIDLAPNILCQDFEFQWHSTNNRYVNFFPKVCRKKTLFVERHIKDRDQLGIFVDVFPLDLSPSYSSWLDRKKKILRRLSYILTNKTLANCSFSQRFFKYIGYLIPKKTIFSIMDRILTSIKKKGTSHYANFGSQYKLSKQTMPVEWYGDGTRLSFEGHYYIAPTEYIKVVTSIFGPNYMELPPIDMRRTHYPKHVIFSDGDFMSFPEPEKILKVSDLETAGCQLL